MLKKITSASLFISSMILLGFVLAGSAQSKQDAIKEVQDLDALGKLSRDRQTPILIMFSQHNCAYCVVLEEDYLKPMLKSGDYRNKVIIRKVRIDSFESLRGFDGKPVDADQFATNYRAYVTPTMVFLDHEGTELTDRLMGVGTEGFFASQIDQAIEHSLSRLRRTVALK